MRGLTEARHVKQPRFGKWNAGDTFKVGRDEFTFVALVRDAQTDRSWIEATFVATGKKRNFNPDVLAKRAKAAVKDVAYRPVKVVKAAPGEGAKRSRAVKGTPLPPGTTVDVHPADWPAPTETTWRAGCRCEPCKAAKREMNRRYRARGNEAAYRQRKRVKRRAEKAAKKGEGT